MCTDCSCIQHTHIREYFLNKQSHPYMYYHLGTIHSVKNKIGNLRGLLQRVCILIPVHLYDMTVIMTILFINSIIFCCMEDTQSLR